MKGPGFDVVWRESAGDFLMSLTVPINGSIVRQLQGVISNIVRMGESIADGGKQ